MNCAQCLVRTWGRGLLLLSLGVFPVLCQVPCASAQEPTAEFDTDDLFGGLDSPSSDGVDPILGADGDLAADPEAEGPREEDVYQEALLLVEQGNCAEAIEKFSLLVIYGRSLIVPALFERGKCFVELKETDLAVQSFRQAFRQMQPYGGVTHEGLGIEIQPYQVLLEIAKLEVEQGRIPDAIEDLADAIERKPTEPELFYYRGLALSKGSERISSSSRDLAAALDGAISSFDRAIDYQDDYAEAYFERARAKADLARMTGEWDEAIDDFEKASELDPENLEYTAQKGFAFIRRAQFKAKRDSEDTEEIVDDFQKGIAAFSQFIDQHPGPDAGDAGDESLPGESGLDGTSDRGAADEEEEEDVTTLENVYNLRADARISLATHLPVGQRQGLYEASVEDCTTALEVEPRFPFAYFNRGIARRLLGEFAQATDDLTEALELAPTFYEANLRRGIIWFHLQDYELALGDFSAAMMASPDGRAQFWSGLAHAMLGNHGEAAEAYSNAIRENPGNTFAYSNRGIAYLHLGSYQRAIDDFNELIRRDRTNALAYKRRGLAYAGLDQDDRARVSFEKARRLNPSLFQRPDASE